VHGWSFNDRQSPQVRRLYVEAERAAARVTDRIVCVARHDVTRGMEQGIGHSSQYVVLRSGIDPALYAAPEGARADLRSAIGATEGSVVVGTIANFKPQKAPLDFVEAARLAFAKNPSLRFVFAGDGPMRPDVERAIDGAGLRGVVTLLGWRDDVPNVLAGMDIFLLSSLFEGLPRVVLQAMAASVPVVVTDTGGVTEVVTDGETGIVVPPGRPESAAAAIVTLAADESARARLAGAARERLGDEYDIDRMVARLESIYDELLDERVRSKTPATSASHLGSESPGH
jgi:glycosyltransferase involved in cell wall biosynthesis